MQGVLFTKPAILVHLDSVRIVLLVLHCVVISLFAFLTSQRNLYPHIHTSKNLCSKSAQSKKRHLTATTLLYHSPVPLSTEFFLFHGVFRHFFHQRQPTSLPPLSSGAAGHWSLMFCQSHLTFINTAAFLIWRDCAGSRYRVRPPQPPGLPHTRSRAPDGCLRRFWGYRPFRFRFPLR